MAVFTTAGSIRDGVYRPILRPRRGELAALSHLAAADATKVMPILELEPGPGIVPLIRQLPPRTGAIAIDFGRLPDPADLLTAPSLDLAEELAELGVAMLPVLRAYESGGRLAAHGMAARMHLRRAVLRLQPHVDAGSPTEADAVTGRLLRGTGLELPTLRYTADRHWWIYRWARRGGRGDDRCHDLCRTLVASPHWPPAGARFSWGDAEIARRARIARGAGSSASWISWSTSHHIAHVVQSLVKPQSVVRLF